MIWKTINGWPYEVSEDGQVRRTDTGKLIARRERHGYLRVGLCRDGKRRDLFVHRLVAFAFLGEPPVPDLEVAHNDNDPTNNHWSNLRWDTHVGNCADKTKHGTLARGTGNGKAKLTEECVRTIRASSGTNRALASKFGVSEANISLVRSGQTWTHVT